MTVDVLTKYYNSIVDSTMNYLKKLQYLAQNNSKDVDDLFTLYILNKIFEWAEWFEIDEFSKTKLKKKINYIINCNHNLELVNFTDWDYYKNVNIPQTIWTLQRVYDNLENNNINELT